MTLYCADNLTVKTHLYNSVGFPRCFSAISCLSRGKNQVTVYINIFLLASFIPLYLPYILLTRCFSRDFIRSSENQNSAPADGQQQAGGAEEEGDFPTFDKWSAQYLAEQEKQKIEKGLCRESDATKSSIELDSLETNWKYLNLKKSRDSLSSLGAKRPR